MLSMLLFLLFISMNIMKKRHVGVEVLRSMCSKLIVWILDIFNLKPMKNPRFAQNLNLELKNHFNILHSLIQRFMLSNF